MAGNSNAEPLAMAVMKEPLSFCETLIGATPGVSDRRSVKLRPLRGRSFTCLVPMTVPNSAVELCSCSPVAVTVITSDPDPALSARSIVAVLDAATQNTENRHLAKNIRLPLTAYLARGKTRDTEISGVLPAEYSVDYNTRV